jgi:acyl dehydratase
MSTTLDSANIGDVLAEFDSGHITREQLAAYAQASGDLNPLHLDPEFARKAGFDDVVVHGMLSMALLGRLLTEKFSPSTTLRRFDTRFVAVLVVGGSLTCRAKLESRVAGVLKLYLEAVDGRGKLIISGNAELALA